MDLAKNKRLLQFPLVSKVAVSVEVKRQQITATSTHQCSHQAKIAEHLLAAWIATQIRLKKDFSELAKSRTSPSDVSQKQF